MIGSECSEWTKEGSCVAKQAGMEVVASKVTLPAYRAGIPGKEEFCFFVCPLSPPAGREVRVAMP
jgi:hypothetical protein